MEVKMEGTEERKAKPKAEAGTIATFQQNRSFELYAGGTVYRFGPYESKRLPAEAAEDPEFLRLCRLGYFAAQEV
jgi:hypothetical protein